jgi:hypothetical protein
MATHTKHAGSSRSTNWWVWGGAAIALLFIAGLALGLDWNGFAPVSETAPAAQPAAPVSE